VLGVVLGAEPAGIGSAFELEDVDVGPAALLGEMVTDFMLGEGGDCPRDAADIPGSLRGQG
jgi:hypothetical protein